MKDKIRVGVIGSGIGASHVRGYALLPEVDIVAVAGADRERTAALAAEHKIPHVYDDYRELLTTEKLDAVSIATPNATHGPIASMALEQGLHVLCEKPLSSTLGEAEEITEAAHQAGSVFMMMFNYRFRADSLLLKEAVACGELGKPYYFKAGWMRESGIPGIGTWFTQKALSGGGPLIDLGVHILDLALWLLDHPRVRSVSASTHAAFGPRGRGGWGGARFEPGDGGFEVEDLASAFIRLENGVTLVLETSWALFGSYGDDYYLHLYGDDGGAEIDVHHYEQNDTLRFYKEMVGARTEMRPRLVLPRERAGHNGAVREFIAAIREGRAASAPVDDALVVQRVIDAIYRSAQSGHEILL